MAGASALLLFIRNCHFQPFLFYTEPQFLYDINFLHLFLFQVTFLLTRAFFVDSNFSIFQYFQHFSLILNIERLFYDIKS